jgi:hypothetical protein
VGGKKREKFLFEQVSLCLCQGRNSGYRSEVLLKSQTHGILLPLSDFFFDFVDNTSDVPVGFDEIVIYTLLRDFGYFFGVGKVGDPLAELFLWAVEEFLLSRVHNNPKKAEDKVENAKKLIRNKSILCVNEVYLKKRKKHDAKHRAFSFLLKNENLI